MQSSILLPNKYKLIGTALLVVSLALGILVRFRDLQFAFLNVVLREKPGDAFDDKINFTDEFALSGIILGLLFIAFAREKREDEFINKSRSIVNGFFLFQCSYTTLQENDGMQMQEFF